MLIDELRENIKIALKEKLETKNDTKYSVYKNILDKAQKDAKEKKTEIITDDYVITAARKELKQLEDTLSYITKESDIVGTSKFIGLRNIEIWCKEIKKINENQKEIDRLNGKIINSIIEKGYDLRTETKKIENMFKE